MRTTIFYTQSIAVINNMSEPPSEALVPTPIEIIVEKSNALNECDSLVTLSHPGDMCMRKDMAISLLTRMLHIILSA